MPQFDLSTISMFGVTALATFFVARAIRRLIDRRRDASRPPPAPASRQQRRLAERRNRD